MNARLKVHLSKLIASPAKGEYILILELTADRIINVGRLGAISFPKGFYAYVGSALGGFKSRINRHLVEDKKPKWHIDYLLNEARILQVILHETEQRLECLLSQALANELLSIAGFGSSDCQCRSHLYFASHRPNLEMSVGKAIAQITTPEKQPKESSRF
ncbi:MAG: GIY-YIG nuclease family protein [Chloroflexi bacterium]|nr:GIY-YIG nuclease family protein [Chloroflexota bacterium]